MKHTQAAGGIVVGPDGRVLVVTNEIGSRTLPKGTMEPGETPIQAAEREIKEESGLTNLKIHRQLGTIIRPGYSADNAETPSVIKHIQVFLVTTNQIQLNPQIEDIQVAEWVEPDDVAKTLTRPAEAEFFEAHRHDLVL